MKMLGGVLSAALVQRLRSDISWMLGCYGAGRIGADVATRPTAIPTQIQQLFDDAGPRGGLSQTAALRGQIARFLHKADDFH
jgi:hypothetical protein